jgi:hypothetical protein
VASTDSRPSPAVIVSGVLAGLQVLTSGMALADIVGQEIAAFAILMVAAAQVATTVIIRGQVTPWADVVAKATPGGEIIAGPAAPQPTGTVIGLTHPSERDDLGRVSLLYVLACAALGLVALLLAAQLLGVVDVRMR